MNLDILSLLIGALLGSAIGAVVMRERLAARLQGLQQDTVRLEGDLAREKERQEDVQKQMSDHFAALSSKVAQESQKSFLTLAEQSFKRLQENAKGDLEKKEAAIKTLVEPVSKSLEKMDEKIIALEKARENAYGALTEHLRNMKADQERLRTETAQLSQALRSPTKRGQWGEMQLKRTLEVAGLVEGVHFVQQETIDTEEGKQRPDVIVKLPDGKQIVIDAKAPIDAYMDAVKDDATLDERAAAEDRHARHVRDHVKTLASKAYWKQFDMPELVVMFLPGESYMPAAVSRDAALLDYAFDNKVIPASPTTLVPMLKAVAFGWQQQKLAENAREISDAGHDLYKRLCTFGGHMEKVGKGISSAIEGYNKAVASFSSRVLPAARKFREYQHLTDDGKLKDMPQLEATPSAAPDVSEELDDTSVKKLESA